jgi:antitoxin (DNA-binding transcriptional repressor) of toxin-antitoxin stability system
MQVSIRELKANPARAIALTRAGERVEITSHRKVVAELVRPPGDAADRASSPQAVLQRLVNAGLVSEPATSAYSSPKRVVFAGASGVQPMSDLVLELRGER